ncbi:MAG: hypothetical protein ACQCN3_02840 [Candidatus Bathyarchaeia archaeon]|jgi:hypothetical protein
MIQQITFKVVKTATRESTRPVTGMNCLQCGSCNVEVTPATVHNSLQKFGRNYEAYLACLDCRAIRPLTFEEFWQAVLKNRVKHWLYWFRLFTKDYLSYHYELMALLNFRDCQTACKTCSKPCKVKPPNRGSSFGCFPEENQYFFESIERAGDFLERYRVIVEVYAVALGAAGVDLNLVDLEEAKTGKKKRTKKEKQAKVSKEVTS